MANNKDNKAFEMMTAVADKTNVNIIPKESKKTTKKATKKAKDEMKGVKIGKETILLNEAPKPVILK